RWYLEKLKNDNKNKIQISFFFKKKMLDHTIVVHYCENCHIEFYKEPELAYCPFCGKALDFLGCIKENEIEGIVSSLYYSYNRNMKKEQSTDRHHIASETSLHEEVEEKKSKFLNELVDVFQTMIGEVPWYNKSTPLHVEIVKRFERTFGK
ncbi:MAG: hypothetical protein J7J61_05360, partial [Candidatus Hydrothermae bacterium]|nr:hypothetical protein [Candidatus Hydrothermae bacterium]